MKRALFSFLLLLFIHTIPVTAQETGPVITSPQPAQVVQGVVEIFGSNDLPGFVSSELAFSYAQDSSTWFTISNKLPQVLDSRLGIWDTTTLTDGDYTLRLRVTLTDGSLQDIFVEAVRVRNYTPTPTDTPTPMTPTATLPPFPTTTPVPATVTPPFPPPTPFPVNPLTVSTGLVYVTLGKGALLVLGLFVVIGLFLRIRRR